MRDAVTIKLHHVHVVSFDLLSGWRYGAALSRVRCTKDTVRTDVLSLIIYGERTDLVGRVRTGSIQPFHPIGVLLKRSDVRERSRLCRKRRIRMAMLTTL